MKRYLRITLLSIFLLSCLCIKANAQNVQAEAQLDKLSMPIGDQTVLHISAQMPLKTAVTFPVVVDSIGKVKIVKSLKADTIIDKNNPNLETIRHNYTITSFDTGVYVLPQFTIHTKTGDVQTSTVTLQIKSVPVDTTKAFYDIKQPFAVSYNLWDWLKDHWLLVLIVLVIVLVAFGIGYYIKNKPKVGPIIPAAPILTIDAIALNKLQDLLNKKLWQQNEVKLYYIELTEILREYLEKRYHIKAHEQTTDEILFSLKRSNITKESSALLKQILTLADLVKFAKHQPTPFENERSMDDAVSFVNQTKQIIQPVANKEDLPK